MASQTDFELSPLAPRRTAEEQARDRDLGFGAVVSRESQQRLLNPDGSFNVNRTGLGFLETFAPYHQSLAISWPGFFAVVGLAYLALNLTFALAYMALWLPAGVRSRGAARARIGHAGRAFQPELLLQHPDVRDDRIRADRTKRLRRQPGSDRRGADRADVPGACDRTDVRALLAPDRLDPLQPA